MQLLPRKWYSLYMPTSTPKKPDFSLTAVLASVFHWVDDGLVGVAFASDFGPGRASDRLLRRRVWSDACDEGFIVRGKREGHLFLFAGEQRDSDGDLQLTLFRDGHDSRRVIKVFNT